MADIVNHNICYMSTSISYRRRVSVASPTYMGTRSMTNASVLFSVGGSHLRFQNGHYDQLTFPIIATSKLHSRKKLWLPPHFGGLRKFILVSTLSIIAA